MDFQGIVLNIKLELEIPPAWYCFHHIFFSSFSITASYVVTSIFNVKIKHTTPESAPARVREIHMYGVPVGARWCGLSIKCGMIEAGGRKWIVWVITLSISFHNSTNNNNNKNCVVFIHSFVRVHVQSCYCYNMWICGGASMNHHRANNWFVFFFCCYSIAFVKNFT